MAALTSDDPAASFVARLDDARARGDGWTARCPVKRCPYRLSVNRGRDGRVLLHCTGGCDVGAITAALGLSVRDLFVPSRRGGGRGR